MKLITSPSELQQISDFTQLETPVAITAPLMVHDRVMIGLYGHSVKYACIDVSVPEFLTIKEFLYYPLKFRLSVHGIQRIWKALDLTEYLVNAGLILDTQIMSYLLNSGRSAADSSLSHLVHEYMSEEYPVWHKVLADNPYPESIHGILAYDAHLIYDLSYELLEIMHSAHPDLKFMYFHIEVPLVRILLEMSRYGISVDGVGAVCNVSENGNRDREFLVESW